MFGLEVVGIFLGTLVWWEVMFLGGLIIGIGFSIFNETSLGLLGIMVVLSIMSWGGAAPLWSSISLINLVWYILGYLVLGVIWSIVKWYLENVKIRDKYKVLKYTKREIKSEIERSKDYDSFVYWIIAWPLSTLGYFLNDFIVDTIKSIAKRLGAIYDRVSNHVLKDV